MWRWRDSLNFLRAGDFGRTRPLSVSAFPQVDSSMAFERRDDRADCVRDTVNGELDGDAENGLLLRFRLQQVDLRQALKGWRELSLIYEERGISTTFVGWLLCDFNRCPKLRKFVEKMQTMVNERSINGAKEAQVAKNKRFPLTCCWGRHLEGAWSCPKSLSTPSRTSNWRKMCANSGKSTATVVDLRAVVRCWVNLGGSVHYPLVNFLHALDIIKTTNAVLSSIPREALSALTPECVPHWRSRRTQVQVWIAFVFTGLSFSCSCVCFIHRIVLRFLS